MSELDKSKIDSRQEKPFNLSLRNIVKGYADITHEHPVKLFEILSRKVDNATKYMMTGHWAAVAMPVGIMVRNGARVAHDAVSGRDGGGYAVSARIAGGLAALGGAWYLGTGLFSALSSVALVSGTVGTVGAIVGAAVATTALLLPMFTLGTLAGATVLGGCASVISVIGALKNIGTGILRSKDAFSGVKYDADTLAAMRGTADEKALENIHREQKLQDAMRRVHYLDETGQKKIYESLKQHFDKAAAENQLVLPAEPDSPEKIAAALKQTPPQP